MNDKFFDALKIVFIIAIWSHISYKAGYRNAIDEVTKNKLHCSSELTNQGVKNED